MPFPRLRNRPSYGWVVVTACLLIGTAVYGSRYSFGIFFKSIEGEFELNRTVTSAVFSTYMMLSCVFTMAGGWTLDRHGPRRLTAVMGLFVGLSLVLTGLTTAAWQLFFTYSLLLAMGTGSTWVMVSATSTRWFDRSRGVAVAVATAGSGLGAVVIAPVAALLITRFDWRGAYIIIGVFCGLTIVALSALLRREPRDAVPDTAGDSPREALAGASSGGLRGLSLREAFRTRSFWFMGASWLLAGASFIMITTHIVPHATDIGMSPGSAAIVLTLMGAASIPARIVAGGVSDRLGRKKTVIVATLVHAVVIGWLPALGDLWSLYLFAVLFGITFGGFDSPVAALVGDVFGLRKLGIVTAGLAVHWAIGAALGPAVGGFVFDVTGTYTAAFLGAAAAMFVSAICLVFTRKEID